MEKVIRAIITFILLGVLLFATGWGLIQYVLSRDVAEVRKEQELKARIALYEAQTEYNRSYVKAQKALAAIRALDAVKQEPWYGYTRLLGESFLNLWPVWLLLVGALAVWFQRGRFTAFENFEFEGIKTVVPPGQIVRLTEMAIQAKAFESGAKIAALQENNVGQRLRDHISLMRTMKSLPGFSEHKAFIAEQDHIHSNIYVPTFLELLQRGEIYPGGPLIFGYRKDTGQPEKGTLQEHYSCIVIGLPGFGKTLFLAYNIASAIYTCGAYFDIGDLHYPHPESLGGILNDLNNTQYINIYQSPKEIIPLMDEYKEELQWRLANKEQNYTPKILVIDEHERWKNVPGLVDFETTLVNEGRKVGMYLYLTSKSAKADKIGDSALRDTCVTSYVFSTRYSNAKTFYKDTDKAKMTKELHDPGEAVFTNWRNDSYIIKVPYARPQDMEKVYDLIIQNGNTLQVNPGVNSEVNLPPINQPVNQGINLTEPGEGELINQINARLQSGLKQKDMAGLIGVSSSMLSQILSGKKSVSSELAGRIKSVLQLDNIIDLDHHRRK